jgi:hypothetical protein
MTPSPLTSQPSSACNSNISGHTENGKDVSKETISEVEKDKKLC